MNPMTTETHPPQAVARVMILGYYDGVTNGVLQFGDGEPVYQFDWIDEILNPDGCDERTFELRPLSGDTLDRLADILRPYLEPQWPVWMPYWQFPSDETRLAVERAFDTLLEEAGPPCGVLTQRTLASFGRIR